MECIKVDDILDNIKKGVVYRCGYKYLTVHDITIDPAKLGSTVIDPSNCTITIRTFDGANLSTVAVNSKDFEHISFDVLCKSLPRYSTSIAEAAAVIYGWTLDQHKDSLKEYCGDSPSAFTDHIVNNMAGVLSTAALVKVITETNPKDVVTVYKGSKHVVCIIKEDHRVMVWPGHVHYLPNDASMGEFLINVAKISTLGGIKNYVASDWYEEETNAQIREQAELFYGSFIDLHE